MAPAQNRVTPTGDIVACAPRGAWVYVEAETVTHGQGRALANSILSDRDGEFARAHQTLFIDPRR